MFWRLLPESWAVPYYGIPLDAVGVPQILDLPPGELAGTGPTTFLGTS